MDHCKQALLTPSICDLICLLYTLNIKKCPKYIQKFELGLDFLHYEVHLSEYLGLHMFFVGVYFRMQGFFFDMNVYCLEKAYISRI